MSICMTVRYECRKTDPEQTFASGKNFKYESQHEVASVDANYECTEDATATVSAVVLWCVEI